MNQPRPKSVRSFFWQGVLILLPVAVLTAVGLYSLSQDRLVVRHEASERAQAIADELLKSIWHDLAPSPKAADNIPYFFLNPPGHLASPPPSSSFPVPQPLEIDPLDAEQLRLWQAAQQAEAAGNLLLRVQSYRDFVDLVASPESQGGEHTAPLARFLALARYRLGLALEKSGDTNSARASFRTAEKELLDRRGPDPYNVKAPPILTESGLPLEPLVRIKRFELEAAPANASREQYEIMCLEFVEHPSPLTPQLLRRMAAIAPSRSTNDVQRCQEKWARDEIARTLFAVAEAKYAPPQSIQSLKPAAATRPAAGRPGSDPSTGPIRTFPRFMAVQLASGAVENKLWLLAGNEDAQEDFYFCHTPASAARRVLDVLKKSPLPDYFGISVDLAGEPLISENNSPIWFELSGGKGGGPHKETFDPATFHAPVLATAHSAPAGDNQLIVKVHLTNTDAMYASQNARTLRYGALIAVAALAALIGFVSARRAFYRQQHLNEMKDNFVSSVSHELRAPIASVRLMAENLEQGRVPDVPKQGEYYRFIVQECRRLSSLIENVLDFSRIEQGRKQYELESTEVVALVRQTIKLMEPVAAQAHITLAATLDEVALNQLPAPQLDGQAMQQALINLIDNAIKHSPKDSSVEVKLEAANQRLRFTVADQGEGIPAEEHARIFERFYRCGSELRRETQGVGIGLSIVKHIVDAHGGTITVESAAGQGSRFIIDLPLHPGTKRT